MTIGTSHSMRMPTRSSPRAAAITGVLLAADLSLAAARVSTRFHRRSAVHERNDRAEDQHQYRVEHDLLQHGRAWHRLHDVVDEIKRQRGQQNDGHTVADALPEPGSCLDAARV